MKIGRGVRQACCLSHIVFKLCSEYLTKEALEGFGDLEQVIRTLNSVDDLFLLVTEETVLTES